MAPQGTVGSQGNTLMSVKWRSVATRIRDVLKPSGQMDDPGTGSAAGLRSASKDSRSLHLPKAQRSRECFPPTGNQAKTPEEARTEPCRRPWSGVAVARPAEPSRADSLTQMPQHSTRPLPRRAHIHMGRGTGRPAHGECLPRTGQHPAAKECQECWGPPVGVPSRRTWVPHISVQSAHTWVPPWASCPPTQVTSLEFLSSL